MSTNINDDYDHIHKLDGWLLEQIDFGRVPDGLKTRCSRCNKEIEIQVNDRFYRIVEI